MAKKVDEVSKEVHAKVQAYVYENYKSFEGKKLVIVEGSSAFLIYKHKHGGPLVLGKGIIS